MSQPSHDDSTGDEPVAGDAPLLFLAIPVVVVLTLFAMGIFGQKGPRGGSAGAYPSKGDLFPEINAQQWINGPPPSREELAGHVLVVDVWASWCGPCRRSAPELVALHQKYKDRGVLFVGLSTDHPENVGEIQKFVDRYKITWPNGYDADRTVNELGVEAIPRVWVVGKDGKVVWEDNETTGTIERAIEAAL